jgi:PAS domain S-box-containing protein
MRGLAAAKLAELERTVTLLRAGQASAALDVVRTGEGKRLMDAIRADVEGLRTASEARRAAARAAHRGAGAWVGPLGLCGMASLLLGAVALEQRRHARLAAADLASLEQFTRVGALVGGMLRGAEGRIAFWSAGLERLYGHPAEAALGEISHALLATQFPAPLQDIEAELRARGDWQGELTHRHRDGHAVFVLSHWVLRRGARGQPDMVIEVNSDISALKHARSQLQLTLDASGLGSFCWEVGGSGATVWDARLRELFGVSADAVAGFAAWSRLVMPEDLPTASAGFVRALDPADPRDDYGRAYRVVHPDGRVVSLETSARVFFTPDPPAASGRRALRVLGTVRDVTAARLAEQDRQRADTVLRTIVDSAPGLIYAKDRQGRVLLANAAALAVIGKPWTEVRGRAGHDYLDDAAQAEAIAASDRRVMERGQTEIMEEVGGGEGGQARTWLATKTPLRGIDGEVVGVVGVSVEITERKRAEDRRRLLVHELNHRVKNTLATVQAIAAESLRGLDPAVRGKFDDRLLALAAAHDVLTQEDWKGADIGDVVTGALKPFGGAADARLRIAGPPLRLKPRAALALAMGLHELATNALKYGALLTEAGRVQVRWTVREDRLVVVWSERGGPPVTPPEARGFGSRMIERSLAMDLGGAAVIRFEREGVTCSIDVPLSEVAAVADVVAFPRVGAMEGTG